MLEHFVKITFLIKKQKINWRKKLEFIDGIIESEVYVNILKKKNSVLNL